MNSVTELNEEFIELKARNKNGWITVDVDSYEVFPFTEPHILFY